MAGGLSKEQRAALMTDSVEGTETEVEPKPVPPPAPKPPVDPPAPPPAPVVVPPQSEMAQLIQGLTDAMRQSSRETAQIARNPIPESYLQGGFPDKGVYSHPDGAHANTKLKCPMFMGIYSDDGVAKPAFEIFESNCTENERVLLNQLEPGIFPVERNDGRIASWRVVLQKDDLGDLIRLVIAVPVTWLTKEQQAQMPGQPNFLRQLTATPV